MQNPFTLTFGKSPLEPVERPVQTKEIIDTFTAEQINQQMFIITGVRGSGKTVMMTETAAEIPCPKEPLDISTPGICFMSGCPCKYEPR